jgi:hypothetical protein
MKKFLILLLCLSLYSCKTKKESGCDAYGLTNTEINDTIKNK